MTPEELIKLMRTCNINQVYAQLLAEKSKEGTKSQFKHPHGTMFDFIANFYKAAAARKP